MPLPPIEPTDFANREMIHVTDSVILYRDTDSEDRGFTPFLDGHPIPHIIVTPMNDDYWAVTVRDALTFHLSGGSHLAETIPLLANAMAVAAGFSCFGTESRLINPYRVNPYPDYPPPGLTSAEDQALEDRIVIRLAGALIGGSVKSTPASPDTSLGQWKE